MPSPTPHAPAATTSSAPATRNLTRAEAKARTEALTVLGYEVEVDLRDAADPASATFPTRTTLRLRSAVPETFLDFIGPQVDELTVDGEPRGVRFDGYRVTVDGLRPGVEHEITVRGHALYSRSGEGMHRYVDPADGLTYLYTHYEPADARRVFANLDQPDLKAPFTFVLVGPADWQLRSNQPVVSREEVAPGVARQVHAPTPPLSTYITCIAAGPYHHESRTWSGRGGQGEPVEIELGLLCRRSLADALDADDIFTVTEQGLGFFHEAFGYTYPWGKYDQVFVPEYNIGAMENPGLVTFADARYLFPASATEVQYERRANTILHEMAHMWFGDLATPAWWDDLWLKESFADYMGVHANAAATRFTDAWTPFCVMRKAWAYQQDQLPTTHPVIADIPDVEAAKQNFDGITYAKGASVLKQLVAHVGLAPFFEGARRYFAKHAFAATTLDDLLVELEAASGRELGDWVDVWLRTTGIATLMPRVELDAAGSHVERLVVEQDGLDPVSGVEVLRPHTLVVGLYRLDGDVLRRTDRLEVEIDGAATEIAAARGLAAPDLVVVNDDDLTYAKVRFDERSLQAVERHLASIESSLTRAVVWSALYNACRDGALPAGRYVDIVLAQGAHEPDVALLTQATGTAVQAVGSFATGAERPALRRRLLDGVWEQLRAAAPGSDHQLVWARVLAAVAKADASRADDIRDLLDGTLVVEGLDGGDELRWALLEALACTGHVDADQLAAERAADPSSQAPVRHLQALSSLPDAATKRRAFDAAVAPAGRSNDEVTALATGFSQPGHGPLVDGYLDDYLAAIEGVWAANSQEIAQRVVLGLFPRGGDLADGAQPEQMPVPVAMARWLDAHPDAPRGLRRLVVEQRDHVLRALRCQAMASITPTD